MDGYEFEYQCAKILKRKHFSKIKVTQSSGDQGIAIGTSHCEPSMKKT